MTKSALTSSKTGKKQKQGKNKKKPLNFLSFFTKPFSLKKNKNTSPSSNAITST